MYDVFPVCYWKNTDYYVDSSSIVPFELSLTFECTGEFTKPAPTSLLTEYKLDDPMTAVEMQDALYHPCSFRLLVTYDDDSLISAPPFTIDQPNLIFDPVTQTVSYATENSFGNLEIFTESLADVGLHNLVVYTQSASELELLSDPVEFQVYIYDWTCDAGIVVPEDDHASYTKEL